MESHTFACSICGEASHRICTFCTKDSCSNHLCQRCLRCSDCCLCESPSSSADEPLESAQHVPISESDIDVFEEIEDEAEAVI